MILLVLKKQDYQMFTTSVPHSVNSILSLLVYVFQQLYIMLWTVFMPPRCKKYQYAKLVRQEWSNFIRWVEMSYQLRMSQKSSRQDYKYSFQHSLSSVSFEPSILLSCEWHLPKSLHLSINMIKYTKYFYLYM